MMADDDKLPMDGPEHTERRQPHSVDPLLVMLINIVNEVEMGAGITLNGGGTIVSGILVSAKSTGGSWVSNSAKG